MDFDVINQQPRLYKMVGILFDCYNTTETIAEPKKLYQIISNKINYHKLLNKN